MKDIHLPPPAPKNHHPQVSVWPFQEGFLRAWSSVVIFFLLLVLLLSDAGCDVTFQIHISEPQPVSTFNLNKSIRFRQEIYYT